MNPAVPFIDPAAPIERGCGPDRALAGPSSNPPQGGLGRLREDMIDWCLDRMIESGEEPSLAQLARVFEPGAVAALGALALGVARLHYGDRRRATCETAA